MKEDLTALKAERDEIEQSLVELRATVEMAKAEVKAGGEYADPIWFAKVQNDLRAKGRRHQALLRKIAEMERSGRENDRRAEKFVREAERRLDPTVFAEIMKEAQDE